MRDQQSEIAVDEDVNNYARVDPEAEKDRIRKIVSYQKSLHLSSSLVPISTSCSTSSRSLSSSNRSGNLLKVGGMSLGRLFDMEHTSLASHLNNYSASPITRPVFLWGSNSSEDLVGNWSPVKSFTRSSGEDLFAKEQKKKSMVRSRQNLRRKRSYRALPRFRMWWRCRGFRMLSRLRRLKIIMCGKILGNV